MKNTLLLAAVVLIAVFPLWWVQPPVAVEGGDPIEIFAGADSQAEGAIKALQPNYEPWFQPLFEPPSGEVESLLFALQAALGAGFLGYYFGRRITLTKNKSSTDGAAG